MSLKRSGPKRAACASLWNSDSLTSAPSWTRRTTTSSRAGSGSPSYSGAAARPPVTPLALPRGSNFGPPTKLHRPPQCSALRATQHNSATTMNIQVPVLGPHFLRVDLVQASFLTCGTGLGVISHVRVWFRRQFSRADLVEASFLTCGSG